MFGIYKLDVGKYDILIFDCDGVIFDTTILKLKAFEETLSDFDDKYIDEFINYFKSNFGRSRFIHAKYFIEEILKQPFQLDLYNKIIKDFSLRSEKIYEDADLCDGVLELLSKIRDKQLYVASGSDQAELRKVFKKRDIDQYFNIIFGSPNEKIELVKTICSKYISKKILMIGDAEADYLAAKNTNIDFLFISRYSVDHKMIELSKKEKFMSVFELKEITNIIR